MDSGDSAFLSYNENENTFLFSYENDLEPLEPLGQTQTITLTATSTSSYGVFNERTSTTSEFDLTFLNPCANADFVTLLSNP